GLHRVAGVLLSFPGPDHADRDRGGFEKAQQVPVERRADVDRPCEFFPVFRFFDDEGFARLAILSGVICGYLRLQYELAFFDRQRSKIRQSAFGCDHASSLSVTPLCPERARMWMRFPV